MSKNFERFVSDDGRTFIHEMLEKGYNPEAVAVTIAAKLLEYIYWLTDSKQPKTGGEDE